MAEDLGTGEIPSYKNMVAGEVSGGGMWQDPTEDNKNAPVLGNR